MENFETHFNELIIFIDDRILTLQSSLGRDLCEKPSRKFVFQGHSISRNVAINSLLVGNCKSNSCLFCKANNHRKLHECIQVRDTHQRDCLGFVCKNREYRKCLEGIHFSRSCPATNISMPSNCKRNHCFFA